MTLAENCYSDCFTLSSQSWDPLNNSLLIGYTKMTEVCMKGQIIKLTCPGFKNPISRGYWPGFKILTFDSEP